MWGGQRSFTGRKWLMRCPRCQSSDVTTSRRLFHRLLLPIMRARFAHCRNCNEWFWDIEWAALIVMVSIAVVLVAVVTGIVTLRQTRNATARSAVNAPILVPPVFAGKPWSPWAQVLKGLGENSADPRLQQRWMSESAGNLHVCTLEIRPFADAALSYPNEAIEFSYVSDLGSIPSIERWNRVSVSKQDHGVLRLSGCVEILDVAVDRH